VFTFIAPYPYIPFSFAKDITKDITFVFYFAEDEDNENISKYFGEFYDLVVTNPNSKILVHCYAGMSRSASIVAAYMIKNMSSTKKLKIDNNKPHVHNY
jgi:predicted protein tyrosine phosphatase